MGIILEYDISLHMCPKGGPHNGFETLTKPISP